MRHALMILALSLATAEITAALLFTLPRMHAHLRENYDRLAETVSSEQVRDFGERGWDPALGWIYRPGTTEETVAPDGRHWRFTIDERGSRTNPYPGGPAAVSVYGDSFAFCAEVNDDETWEYYLSAMLGTTVLNFGVPGYGTDQAVWRMARDLPRNPTDVVVLVVFSEDIGRMLNMYRPFYLEDTAFRVGFKPMLAPGDGGFVVVPNPLRRPESREDFLLAFEAAKQHDFWYALNQRRPADAFPYSLALVAALRFELVDHTDLHRLYASDEGRERLLYALREFAALTTARNAEPVVLFIPTPGELRGPRERVSYAGFVAALRARPDVGRLRVLDLLDFDFDRERFNTLPYRGHASPYGNRVIAGALLAALGDRLLPTARGPVAARHRPIDAYGRGG
jgi:hypothetical protein